MVRLGFLYLTSKPAFNLYQISMPTSSDTDVAQLNISTLPLCRDPQGPIQFLTNLSLSPMQRYGHVKLERY